MNILRWIGCIAAFFVVNFLSLILSNYYFDWLLPLNSSKDWVVFALTIPISGAVLFLPVILSSSTTLIAPKPHLAAIILGFVALISLFGSFYSTGFTLPKGMAALNAFQNILVTLYLFFFGFNEAKEKRKKGF